MTKQEEQAILEIQNLVLEAFRLVLDGATQQEREYIQRDINTFVGLFDHGNQFLYLQK